MPPACVPVLSWPPAADPAGRNRRRRQPASLLQARRMSVRFCTCGGFHFAGSALGGLAETETENSVVIPAQPRPSGCSSRPRNRTFQVPRAWVPACAGKRNNWRLKIAGKGEGLDSLRKLLSARFDRSARPRPPRHRQRRPPGLLPDAKKKPRIAGLLVLQGGVRCRDQRFIELKNSSLDLVFFILSSRNSIAAISSIGCSSLRRIQIFCSSSGSISRSSRRVPERLMSMAG